MATPKRVGTCNKEKCHHQVQHLDGKKYSATMAVSGKKKNYTAKVPP
jgi:hypothetical protein